MDGEEKVGVGGCWRCTHGGPCFLMPERISKLEYVVAHHDGQGLYECISGDALESGLALVQVLGDFDDGMAGMYIGIHRGGVGGEEAGARRERGELKD